MSKKPPYFNAMVIGGDSDEQTVTLQVFTDQFEIFPMGKRLKIVLVEDNVISPDPKDYEKPMSPWEFERWMKWHTRDRKKDKRSWEEFCTEYKEK